MNTRDDISLSEAKPLGRPRFSRINPAAKYAGRSRGQLYIWAARYLGLFRKDGKTTLVDLNLLDAILDELPAAKINLPAQLRRKSPQPQPQPARTRRRRAARA